MDSLIPTHALKVISTPEGRDDPTVYEYRGARIRAWKAINKLEMAGHPYDAKHFGNTPHVMMLVDWWLDKGRMPPPYVWPVPDRKPPA